ncbi:MAG: NAD(P)-dependent alcohol dehydrogenase [Saprospiraceae bacterium]|nr:NAD(P)-dependent alcohol dehydrogenase [Saprospiraceae bacterium]
MNKMRAVTQRSYGGPDVLRIEHLEKPSPNENQLLIRVFSVPITAAGSFMREGSPYIGRLAIGLLKPKHPISGVCFSGEVEEIGKNIGRFRVGDKVFGEVLFEGGTHCEYITIEEDALVAIKPESMSHAEAAPICDGHLTSMNFLTRVANLQSGQKILIIGAAGSLGNAAVQIATEMGAHVTAVCSPGNTALVKSLGAHEVIDRTAIDFTTGDAVYDVIYDAVGKSSFGDCKNILKVKGLYMSPVLSLKLLLQSLLSARSKGKKAKFSATGMLSKPILKQLLHRVVHTIDRGKLHTFIDRKYPMDEVARAHHYVDSGKKRGNVVLNIV